MLSGFMGLKGGAGGQGSRWTEGGAQPRASDGTAVLEWGGGGRNAWCGDEMHRFHEELRLRRQRTGALLTLMHEMVGIEQE